MVGSNQFAIVCGGVANQVMAMNNYSGKNGLVFSFIFKTNIHGQVVICYFINVVTLIYHKILRESMAKLFFESFYCITKYHIG